MQGSDMAIFQVFRKASGRRRRGLQPRTRLAFEQFEPRVMLDAAGLVDPIFAPDTPQEYVTAMMQSIEAAAIGRTPGISAFQFNDSDRWSNTSSQGGGFSQGDPTTLTWSIVPDGTSIYGYADEATSPSDLQSSLNAIYGNIGAWQPILQQSFDRWGDLSGITYVYEPNDDGSAWTATSIASGQIGVRGDIRIAGHNIDGNYGILAYNFFPDVGDMVIDTGDMTGENPFFGSTAGNSLRLRNVVTHEGGHGLGVEHVESSDAEFLLEPYVNLNFDGPQYDDILAVHRGYGDKNEVGGNDSSSSPTDLGAILDGQTVTVGADAVDAVVAATDVAFVSIDDNSDIDYYSFTVGADSTVDVTLAPLGPTYNQGPQGGTQSSFNGAAQSDLSLAVVDLNGTTVIASANATGLGGSEILVGVGLADAGQYFVRVTGANNAAQLYQLDVSVSSSVANGPTAVDDSGSVAEDGSVAIDVLANDTAGDAAIDPTTVLASAGANGSTSVDATTGVVTYWPDADFNGTDFFTYTVRDVNGNASNAATVSVTVTPVTDISIVALDADKLEGDGGTTPFTFEISLDSAATSTVSVDWAVDAGGDVDATDFGGVLPSGSESFSTGQTSRTITIDVSGDLTIENDEAFSVSLSSPVGGDIGIGTASGNIRTDDLPPVDTFVDVANSEGTAEGTASGTFLNTHEADGVSESITEEYEARPRKSSMEHSWNIDVTGGDISVTFELIAGHSSSAETFAFEYFDGSLWQPLVTLNSTEMTSYSVPLPTSLSGPVTVRMVDTLDRRNDPVDSVLVDYLAIISEAVGSVDYPPTLADVLVASTNWSPTFKAEIASSHGDVDGFYRIPVGDGSQLAPLPWSEVDQIRVVFSEDVAVSQGDLDLVGVNVPTYAFSGFSYDPGSFTATWATSQPIDAEKLLVDLSDTIQDTTGNSLDVLSPQHVISLSTSPTMLRSMQ
jgi:serralysin